jgi:hypothetical protein
VRIKDVIPFKLAPTHYPTSVKGRPENAKQLRQPQLLSRGCRLESIKAAVLEEFGTEAARIFDESPGDTDHESWWAQWSRMTDPESDAKLWFRRPVFLALFRERSTGRVRLALAVNWYHWALENEYAVQRIPLGTQDEQFAPWPLKDDEDSEVYVLEKSPLEGCLFFDRERLIPDGRTEYDNKLLFIPSDSALDLACLPARKDLDSNLTTLFIPSFNDVDTRYSPGQHDTISGAILRNLAYAPVDERLDDQLLRDAREKSDALQAFIGRETEAYRAGVQRLT